MTNMIEIDGIQIPESKILELGYTKPKTSKVFLPEDGQEFFFINARGEVSYDVWTNHEIDLQKAIMGNRFINRATADKAVAKRQATVRVLNKLRELEGDWVADWGDSNQLKHGVRYDFEDKCFYHEALSTNIDRPAEWFSITIAWRHVLDNMESDVKLMMGIDDA